MKTDLQTRILRAMHVLVCVLLVHSLLADSAAKRKNNCNNGKRFKHWVCLAGGTSNCGNTGKLGTAWHCTGTYSTPTDVYKWRGTSPCACGSTSLAVEGHALSNATTKYDWTKKHEFGCAWPNKWKGGMASIYQVFQGPLPMKYKPEGSSTVPYVSYAYLGNGTDDFNYTSNQVTLNNLSIVLEKYTPDMADDYSSFVIEILKVTGQDNLGEDITETLYRAAGTIYDESLVIDDGTGQFTTGSFTEYSVGTGGKGYSYSNSAKVISLTTDIVSTDDLTVRFYTDCNDYGGGGRLHVATSLVEHLNKTLNSSAPFGLQIVQNPVTGEYLEFVAFIAKSELTSSTFYIRDLSGKVVREWHMALTSSSKVFQVNVATLPKGIYFISFIFGDTEYGRKVILGSE